MVNIKDNLRTKQGNSSNKYVVYNQERITIGACTVFHGNFTSVNAGKLLSEVHKGRQFGDPIFSGISWIIDFDKSNVQIVSFGIDFFQPLQYIRAGLTFICI